MVESLEPGGADRLRESKVRREMNAASAQRWLLAAVVVAHLGFFATALLERPKVDSDASAGMLVWQSMERGARWNCALEPDPADIARDHQNFLTWWSPGQYMVVGPLHRLGLSWGISIASATLLCSLAGLAGFWHLYLGLGFTRATCAWAVAILSVLPHVTRQYGEFLGGELPLFAVSPWLLSLIFRLRPIRFRSLFAFAGIYFLGAMAKLSFCVAAAAALAGVGCAEAIREPGARRLALIAAKAAAMLATAQLLLWLVFLRHGATPASTLGPPQAWWYVLPHLLAQPAGSVFGMESIVSRIFLFPGHAVVAGLESLAPLAWILFAGAAAFYWALARKTPLPGDFKVLVAGMAGACVLILGYLITAGASISIEDRHFFPVGAVFLPAFVELARSGTSFTWRWLTRGLLLGASSYGLVALAVHAHQLANFGNVGRAGFTQHLISPGAMRVLHSLDDQDAAAGTLIYVPSPEISFELRRARVLSTYDLAVSPGELRSRVRHGKVPILVVLSNPVLETGGRDDIVRRSFVDYSPDEWKKRAVGDWTFYYQGDWPIPP
jgi:hypothetical protein